MKKLATLTAAAVLVLGFAGAAQAGGSSDTTGRGLHCYLFFDNGTIFAQAMINQEEDTDGADEMTKKVGEMIAKYVTDLGFDHVLGVGNATDGECDCEFDDCPSNP